MNKICPKCAAKNVDDALFCADCGASLQTSALKGNSAHKRVPAVHPPGHQGKTKNMAGNAEGKAVQTEEKNVCAKCGMDNVHDARFCADCGTPLPPAASLQNAGTASAPVVNVAGQQAKLTCPKCGSPHIHIDKKGYELNKKACCGSLIFGPLGLLCGQKGANKIVRNCVQCLHKW